MDSKKLTRFVLAATMALLLGTTLSHAQVIPIDTDGDGVPDTTDECPTSDFSPTVVINGINTGIPNTGVNAVGCTLADLLTEAIDACQTTATNHGQFVSCVSHETNILKRARTISGKQKGKIQSIVARMH